MEPDVKTPIQFFVSYAHADKRAADKFLQRLQEQLAPSRRYDYVLWRDTELLAGERWDDVIHQALAECQFGLLLISPRFLSRDYILTQELPRFIGGDAKPFIAVMLQSVDFDRHDLHGLDAYQIFRLDNQLSFEACGAARKQREFAEALFAQIERRLDRLVYT